MDSARRTSSWSDRRSSAFVEAPCIPTAPVKVAAWMVIIIVARELTIHGLRLLAASKGVVLAAERFGKHKTISQIAAIIALCVDAKNEWPSWLPEHFPRLVGAVYRNRTMVTVVLTAASGLIYLWRNREIYLSAGEAAKNYFSAAAACRRELAG